MRVLRTPDDPADAGDSSILRASRRSGRGSRLLDTPSTLGGGLPGIPGVCLCRGFALRSSRWWSRPLHRYHQRPARSSLGVICHPCRGGSWTDRPVAVGNARHVTALAERACDYSPVASISAFGALRLTLSIPSHEPLRTAYPSPLSARMWPLRWRSCQRNSPALSS